MHHPVDHSKVRREPASQVARVESLHVEVLRSGQLVYDLPTLGEICQARSQDVEVLDPGIRRLVNPHIYHVSLSQKLWDLKEGLIAAARAENIA